MDPTTTSGGAAVETPAAPAQAGARSAGAGPPAAIEVGRSADEMAQIFEVSQRNGCADKAPAWIREGRSLADVKGLILDARTTKGPAQPPAETIVQLTEREAKQYSYRRAILNWALSGGGEGFRGFEREIHDDITQKTPEAFRTHGGLLIPMRLREPDADLLDPGRTRALDSKTATAGAEVVYDKPGELIELLRNRSVLATLGAPTMPGLTAPVPFAKQSSAATGYWVSENPAAAVTASALGFGSINLKAKTLQANESYSRQLLAQASVDIEAMVRNDFAKVHALSIDRAGLHGASVSGEPTGIYMAPDVQVEAYGGVPDWIHVLEAVGKAATKNALMGTLGWATTPGMAARLSAAPKISGAAAGFLWEGSVTDGLMAGYRAIASNQLSAVMTGSAVTGGSEHGMIFGNWADILIGFWGALEVIVDPYALKNYGMIDVTSFQMADVLLRHGESFVKSTGATVS